MAAGDPAGAAEAYRAALEDTPGDPRLIGRLRAAEEALAGDRLESARRDLAEGDALSAWQGARAVQEVLPGLPEARRLGEDAEETLVAELDRHAANGAWLKALALLERADAAGMSPDGWASRRERIRAEGGQEECGAAARWLGEEALGNALLALQHAEALGVACEARASVASVRDALRADLVLELGLDVEGDTLTGLTAPLGQWVADADIPLRLVEPGPGVDLHLDGRLSVDTERSRDDRRMTVERQIDVRKVANPEYAEMTTQAKQLASVVENARMDLWSAQRDLDQLYRAYLRSGSEQLREALYAANRRVEEARERYLASVSSYELLLRRMQTTEQLVEEPVMEQAEVDATEVRVGAASEGRAVLRADWIDVSLPFSLRYKVEAGDLGWSEVAEQDVPAKELVVPDEAQLVGRLADQLGERILDQVREAVRARADLLVGEGDAAREAGREQDAVEAYVRALLLDPEGARPSVRAWLAETRGSTLPAKAAEPVARQGDPPQG